MGDDGAVDDPIWLFAPVMCVVVFTAGTLAGIERALRELGGIALPRCWFTSQLAVRLAAWAALIAGLVDLAAAARRFTACWGQDIPLGLLSFVLATYLLLGLVPLIAAAGLAWQDMPHASKTFVQAAKLAMLGGLAAGLASEVLSEVADNRHSIPTAWDRGCSLLGTASGLLLLGVYGAQADLQAAFGAAVVPPTTPAVAGETTGATADASVEAFASHSEHSEYADGENGLASMGPVWARSWSLRYEFPQIQAAAMLPPETRFGLTRPQGGFGLARPLLLPPADTSLSAAQEPWSNDDFGRVCSTSGPVDTPFTLLPPHEERLGGLTDQIHSQPQSLQAWKTRGSARRPPVCRSQQEHTSGQTPSWPVPMH